LCQKVTVTQDKTFVVVREGDTISLPCEYKGASGTYTMYWYQQKSGKTLQLMAWSTEAKDFTAEDTFKASWTMKRPEDTKSFLECNKPSSNDLAVYFCAASYHSHKRLSCGQHKTCIR
ncbi:hypothetical protein GDO78_014550, partial [Eleutherodactylus coqui]